MADNHAGNNDPEQSPFSRPPNQNEQGTLILGSFKDQPQQGKLILGSFKDQPQARQRQPYQYAPQAQQAQQAQQQVPPVAAYVNVQQSTPAQAERRPEPRKRRRGCLIATVIVLILVCILGSLVVNTTQRVLAFGSAISTQSPLSTQNSYMNTSERTNLLVMGLSGLGHDGAYLTDSMIVISLLPQSHHTSLVSTPRDLWVQVPEGSGRNGKINSVYQYGSNFGEDPVAGGEAAARKMTAVTGLPVKYWMTINFTGFKKVIDAIGGVDVAIPTTFNACYPKSDDAKKDASWIKVQFNKGVEHMDGARAIQYARAREPMEVCGLGTSQNLAELTDFGRSARQQIIIKAALAQVKQMKTWPKLFDAMDALQRTIYTNLSLADLTQFSLKMDLNDPGTARIGLSLSNVLEEDQYYNLHPAGRDWNVIQNYVKKNLYN